jgi:hypothetical protein
MNSATALMTSHNALEQIIVLNEAIRSDACCVGLCLEAGVCVI